MFQMLAERTCREKSNYSGILPKVLDYEDANFVTSRMSCVTKITDNLSLVVASRVQQWLGLTRDYYGAPWKWGDGTLVISLSARPAGCSFTKFYPKIW